MCVYVNMQDSNLVDIKHWYTEIPLKAPSAEHYLSCKITRLDVVNQCFINFKLLIWLRDISEITVWHKVLFDQYFDLFLELEE